MSSNTLHKVYFCLLMVYNISKGGLPMISYKPMLKLLIDKDLKRQDLLTLARISKVTLSKFAKNEYVSLEVIDRLCAALNCQPGELIK